MTSATRKRKFHEETQIITTTTTTTTMIVKRQKKQTIFCPACDSSISPRHSTTDRTFILHHFRDVCTKRKFWLTVLLPSVPLIIYSMLGFINAYPKRFTEVVHFLLFRPRISKTAKLIFSREFLISLSRIWTFLSWWDNHCHEGLTWLTSGRPVTHSCVVYILYPSKFRSDFDIRVFKNTLKKQVSLPTKSIESVNSWIRKRDKWTVKSRHSESYVDSKCETYFANNHTDVNRNRIIWTSNYRLRKCFINRWVVKRFKNRFEYSMLTSTSEAAEACDELQNHFFYVYPQRNPNLAVYDCLSTQWISSVPLTPVTLLLLSKSFASAYDSFRKIHSMYSENEEEKRQYRHFVFTSHCKKYLLFQSDSNDGLYWSIAMQYDFICWWMFTDHFVKSHFVTRDARQQSRISVPFLIPSPEGLCPYCYQFEEYDVRSDKRQKSTCRVMSPLNLEKLLVYSSMVHADETADLCGLQSKSLHGALMNVFKKLYQCNYDLMSVSHVKNQNTGVYDRLLDGLDGTNFM